MDQFFRCLWPVAADGYEIKDIPAVEGTTVLTDSPKRQVIVAKGRGGVEFRDYMRPPPVGEPLLFRTFADLDETPDSVLDFANRFGLLRNTFAHRLQPEDISDWFEAIRQMRHHVELAEAGAYRTEDWSSAAVKFEGGLGSGLGMALSQEGRNGSMAVRIEIPTLRQVMWVQLGLWISSPGDNNIKCEVCGHWVKTGTGTGRRSKRYCRTLCSKTGWARNRKE